MIVHKTMNLFDAPVDSIIVHACNSQGVWGSGIAKAFKERYPYSFVEYEAYCDMWNKERGTATGKGAMSMAHVDEPHWVGWIVTSHSYASQKDPVELIKINTTIALRELCEAVYKAHPKSEFSSIDVYSNKFNSGLFSVPWEDSELILNTVLKDFKRINWIVCDPEGR